MRSAGLTYTGEFMPHTERICDAAAHSVSSTAISRVKNGALQVLYSMLFRQYFVCKMAADREACCSDASPLSVRNRLSSVIHAALRIRSTQVADFRNLCREKIKFKLIKSNAKLKKVRFSVGSKY